MPTNATSAGVSSAIQAANEQAIEFNSVVAHALLTRMADTDNAGKAAKLDRDKASLEFCQLGLETVITNHVDGNIPRDTVVKGFGLSLDAMRAMLFNEGNSFVTAKEGADGADTTYAWKGHGNNVKSIAKGVIEFAGVKHQDDDGEEIDAIIDVSAAESFRSVKMSVESARRYGEDAEIAELREAKELLREVCASLISEVIKSDDVELIIAEADKVSGQLADWNGDVAAQDALSAEAEGDTEGEGQAETTEAA